MTKFILIFSIFLFLTSCDDEIPESLEEMGRRIINNPDILYDLGTIYPSFYDEQYIHKGIMKNDKEINRIIKEIKKNFKSNSLNFDIYKYDVNDHTKKRFLRFGYDLTGYDCTKYYLCRDNFCLAIFIIHIDNSYKLFYLNTTVLDSYNEGY